LGSISKVLEILNSQDYPEPEKGFCCGYWSQNRQKAREKVCKRLHKDVAGFLKRSRKTSSKVSTRFPQ